MLLCGKRMKISATIITFNEESNIKAACESVAWADEIVVVDSESTDATREIAANCGARELRHAIENFAENPTADGYRVPRRTFYQNRWIRGGGWYPDKQLRLFDRTKGHWKQRQIHESVEMDAGARVSELRGDLLHYTSPNAAHHHRMIGERYAPLAAQQMFEEGRRTSVLGVV